jgi:23S rRNA (uracil1939-C5)-methyltransferase
MLNARSSQIVQVPGCLIGLDPVLEKIRELYHDGLWLRLAPKNPDRGHVEIYLRDDDVQVKWNEDYASGGFTQVYQEMNEKLRQEISEWFGNGPKMVLDLFAGNGNISNSLPYSARLCVDIYPSVKEPDFFSQSLYESGALKNIKKELDRKSLRPQVIILDPPRSGLTDLAIWLSEFAPEKIAYVSCDPHTLARDLQKVSGYEVTGAVLLDFFPSTFHYESLIFLERK